MFTSLVLLISIYFSTTIPVNALENNSIEQTLLLADKIRSSDPSKFNDLLSQLELNKARLNGHQQDYYHYLTAYRAVFSGNFQQGISIAKNLINTNAAHDLSIRSNMLIVNTHAVSSNWSKGLSQLAVLLKQVARIENKALYQDAIIVTALFYNQLGQYNLALNYANKVAFSETKSRSFCIVQHLILESKFKLNLLSEDAIEVNNAITACKQANEYLSVSLSKAYLATLYLNNGQYNQALDYINANLAEVEQTKYPRGIAEFYSLLAKIYWQQNDSANTQKYALKTVSQDNGLVTTPAYISSYKLLYQVYKQQGDISNALKYHVKYSDAKEAFIDETKTKHLAFQLAQHKEFENKAQIKILDEKNQRLTLAKALIEKKQENIFLFASLLFTILTAVIIWAYKSWRTQERLQQLAEYDTLTGIFNRGHFVEVANSAISHCQKSQQEISCILFDIDKFKHVNDHFGHAVGDKVLKSIIDACQPVCRHNDIFGRIGGEEFAFILPGCNIIIAQDIANKCRKFIKAVDYQALGLDEEITASFGVTDNTQSGYDIDELLADADCAMYSSKHHGRDTVSIYKN